ncbi:hypothetical protein SAMN04487783_0362 [Agrococcus baldri]|uniref:Lipoprotein n=1 Tax=Agrococcus baldri TaxID=153730 RepID=A0AA94KYM4_9MICO|nr:hypothetical protein [Agrococcus baldri]SFR99561.1 hypothetical protein SAMN04487783_0362 [Agrococcus baldri]
MPRMLAIAAALATVLTVAACSSAQPPADAPPADGAQPAAGAAESAEQAPAQPEALASESGASQSGASQSGASQSGASQSGASESGVGESGASQTAEGAGSALRSGTLSLAAALDAGEPGLPAGSGASVDDVLRLGAVATWIDAPDTLAISLPASADCWPSAAAPVVESAWQLSVEFVAGECAAFDSARTYTIEVPEGIDGGADLEVSIDGLAHRFTLTLLAG